MPIRIRSTVCWFGCDVNMMVVQGFACSLAIIITCIASVFIFDFTLTAQVRYSCIGIHTVHRCHIWSDLCPNTESAVPSRDQSKYVGTYDYPLFSLYLFLPSHLFVYTSTTLCFKFIYSSVH